MSDKRKSDRIACAVPVDGQKLFEKIQTVDISKGGLGFISKHRLPLKKKIVIELNLSPDEKESVLVIGQVKWIQPINSQYRIGVHFEDLQNESKSRLNKYFRK